MAAAAGGISQISSFSIVSQDSTYMMDIDMPMFHTKCLQPLKLLVPLDIILQDVVHGGLME